MNQRALKKYNSNYRQNTVPINLNDDYNTERGNVEQKVWTERQTTWKSSVCIPYVYDFTDGNG